MILFSTSKDNPLKKPTTSAIENPFKKPSASGSTSKKESKTEKAGQKRKSALDEIMEVSVPCIDINAKKIAMTHIIQTY